MADDEVGRGGGRGDDAFDRLTLDDSFVRGAAMVEGSHRDREKDARRRHRKHRRGNRARRTGRWFRRYAPLLLAAVILGGAVFFGTRGQGPLGSVDTVRAWGGLNPVEDVAAATTTTSAPGTTAPISTTSTTITLSVADETPGVCLVWDQTPGLPSPRRTDVVACDELHIFEVTTSFEIDGSPYGTTGPSDEEWDVVFDTECQARADAFLGYPLDPVGRFAPTAIKPTTDGWVAGDRHVLCGMGAVPTSAAVAALDQLTPFAGAVGGADQARYVGVGTCLDAPAPLGTGDPVDCLGPHATEVTGTTDVSGLGPAYPGAAAITAAATEPCRAAARAVYGGVLPPDVATGSYEIAETSWNAGKRTVECIFGRADDAGWIVSPGPARLGSP